MTIDQCSAEYWTEYWCCFRETSLWTLW